MSAELENYPFKDAPLTPQIIAALALELFKGKIVKRNDIGQQVEAYHLQRGGAACQAQSLTASVKRALQQIKTENKVENFAHGLYRFSSDDEIEPDISANNDDNTDCIAEDQTAEGTSIVPLKTIGVGKEMVYAYSYPTYRAHAIQNSEPTWPVKIGMSSNGVSRIFDQVGTALPERPEIRLALMTDNSAALEKMLHSILSQAGRSLDESPGTEWYRTNEDEIESILAFVADLGSR